MANKVLFAANDIGGGKILTEDEFQNFFKLLNFFGVNVPGDGFVVSGGTKTADSGLTADYAAAVVRLNGLLCDKDAETGLVLTASSLNRIWIGFEESGGNISAISYKVTTSDVISGDHVVAIKVAELQTDGSGVTSTTDKRVLDPLEAFILKDGTRDFTELIKGKAATAPTDDDHLANKKYVDDEILAGAAPFKIVRKSSDESVVASSTLQDDDHLLFAVDANSNYIGIFFIWTLNPGNDRKYHFNVPASTEWLANVVQFDGPGNAMPLEQISWGDTDTDSGEISGTNATLTQHIIHLSLRTAGSAGTVTLQWANQSAAGTGTIYDESLVMWKKAV